MRNETLTSEVKLGLVKFQLLLFFVELLFQELILQSKLNNEKEERALPQDIHSRGNVLLYV